MTLSDVVRLRLAHQRLTGHPSGSAAVVVSALGAMQAQDYPSALWAVGVRLPGAGRADVERAIADGTLVRTWLMRGTLHLVASADVRWMLALLGPRIIAGSAYRLRQLEIDDAALERSRDVLREALSSEGTLTRAEIKQRLEAAGVSTEGQRAIHILQRMSLEGLVCPAAPKGRQQTFALLDPLVPKGRPMDRDAALAELARRYFAGHGPATLQDLVWWSGLSTADARRGLDLAREHLIEARVDDAAYWTASARPALTHRSASLFLLPAWDEYVLGYADRSLALDTDAARRGVARGGLFHPAIAVGGSVIGRWDPGTVTRASAVHTLFRALDAPESRRLDEALCAYDRFATGRASTLR